MRETTRSTIAALVAAAAVLFAWPASASAQEHEAPGLRQHRGGFWLSGGVGFGLDEDTEVGGAGYVRLGGTLGDHWALGFDGVAYSRDAEVRTDPPTTADGTVTHSNGTAAVYWFPSVEGGFFVKGGLGVAVARAEVETGGVTISREEEDVGVTAGVGYDVQLGDGNLYLTPNVDVMVGDFENFHFLATVGIGFR